MNFHPLFVHFPIAMFTLYSIIELVPEKLFRSKIHIKRDISVVLLVTGLLGALVALPTGEAIEDSFKAVNDLVEMHSLMANISTWLFTSLLFAHIFNIISPLTVWYKIENRFRFLSVLKQLGAFLYHRKVRWVLALAGLLSISTTGALGGAIAYGPQVDPIVGFVYSLFF